MPLSFQAIYLALCCSVWTRQKILPWPQTYELCSFEHHNKLKCKKQNSQWLFQYSALTSSSSSVLIGLLSFWSFRKGILSLYETPKWKNFWSCLARCTNTEKCICNDLRGSVLTSGVYKSICYFIVLVLQSG